MNKRRGGGFCGPMMLLFAVLLAFGIVKSHPEWFKFGPAQNPPGMDQQLELIYQQPVPKHPPLIEARFVQAGEAFTYYDAADQATSIYVEEGYDQATMTTFRLIIRTGGADFQIIQPHDNGVSSYVAQNNAGQPLFKVSEFMKVDGDGKLTWWRIKVEAFQGGFIPSTDLKDNNLEL